MDHRVILYNLPTFQFLIGRLGTYCGFWIMLQISLFQFLIGRLGTLSPFRHYQCHSLVSIPYRQARYKYFDIISAVKTSGFQFLIGRLGTCSDCSESITQAVFQFLIGRLGTSKIANVLKSLRSFNSLQVGQVHISLFILYPFCVKFQFLIGRLGTFKKG